MQKIYHAYHVYPIFTSTKDKLSLVHVKNVQSKHFALVGMLQRQDQLTGDLMHSQNRSLNVLDQNLVWEVIRLMQLVNVTQVIKGFCAQTV